MFNIIAAVDSKYGIGKNNDIPWKYSSEGKADQAMFKSITTSTNSTNGKPPVILMGRHTYHSCGKLPGRIKVMIGSNGDFKSLADAIDFYQSHDIWVCGGKNLYLEALKLGPQKILITHISGDYDCDIFVTEFANVCHEDPISGLTHMPEQ